MGSGRGDRNQSMKGDILCLMVSGLQWGPVVVTGISTYWVESLLSWMV